MRKDRRHRPAKFTAEVAKEADRRRAGGAERNPPTLVRPDPRRYETSRLSSVLYLPAIRWRNAARFSALHEAVVPVPPSMTIKNIGRFEWGLRGSGPKVNEPGSDPENEAGKAFRSDVGALGRPSVTPGAPSAVALRAVNQQIHPVASRSTEGVGKDRQLRSRYVIDASDLGMRCQ